MIRLLPILMIVACGKQVETVRYSIPVSQSTPGKGIPPPVHSKTTEKNNTPIQRNPNNAVNNEEVLMALKIPNKRYSIVVTAKGYGVDVVYALFGDDRTSLLYEMEAYVKEKHPKWFGKFGGLNTWFNCMRKVPRWNGLQFPMGGVNFSIKLEDRERI